MHDKLNWCAKICFCLQSNNFVTCAEMRVECLPKQSLSSRISKVVYLVAPMMDTWINLGCKVRVFANKFPVENKCNIYACEVQSKFPPVFLSIVIYVYIFHCWKSVPHSGWIIQSGTSFDPSNFAFCAVLTAVKREEQQCSVSYIAFRTEN